MILVGLFAYVGGWVVSVPLDRAARLSRDLGPIRRGENGPPENRDQTGVAFG